MVELIEGFPRYVAAYKASGKVEKEEYERVVMHRVDEVAREFGSINFLVRLETNMENYSLPAFIDYLKVSFEHFSKWNRMAIVTDETWMQKAYEVLSGPVPGEIRSFSLSEYEAAKKWVSEPLA
ncbi:STAS/SEC14 domain-containing protein [Arcticibacter sp. MXS-1]|uniref:STAS/SEC14 domain-containing protein n=1 Tax=Arcticibacter sp. MXS-1 TaxID=3341726 RepID=UPI0035A8FC0C